MWGRGRVLTGPAGIITVVVVLSALADQQSALDIIVGGQHSSLLVLPRFEVILKLLQSHCAGLLPLLSYATYVAGGMALCGGRLFEAVVCPLQRVTLALCYVAQSGRLVA